MVRYKGTDQLVAQYFAITEANYGNKAAGVYTLAILGFPTEASPTMDPELTPIQALRNSSQGQPIRLMMRRKNVKANLKWLQNTLTTYVQKELFTDGDNLYGVFRIYRDGGNFFLIDVTGLKCAKLTVRGSIGEPVEWEMDMIGKAIDTPAALPGTPTYGNESGNDPWYWKDVYIQYDVGGGLTPFPDVTDFEFTVDFGLKPVFVLTAGGLYELTALETTVVKPTARITCKVQNETFFDWLILQTELLTLKLVLPDSKHITFSSVKVKTGELPLRPEDLLVYQLEFEAKSWSHGFT